MFEGKPLKDATITTTQRVVTRSGSDGKFEIELPETRPSQLRISKPSLGTKVVSIAAGTADLALPQIEMFRASSLTLRVEGTTGPVELLLRQGPDDAQQVDVARRQPSLATHSTSFSHLDPGLYTVVAAGRDPLARHGTRLRLEAGEHRAVSIRIEPQRMEGAVLWGERPLPNVAIRFQNEDFRWESTVNADAGGRFTSDVWQRGNYMLSVSRGALHNSYTTEKAVSEGSITVVVPTETMRGRIVDSASERPLPDAHLLLQTELSTLSAVTDSHGSFVFDAIPAVHGTLRVNAEDYLIPEPLEITTETDPKQEIVVKLDSGRGWSTQVFDHEGRPVLHAELIAANGNRFRAVARTDASGKTTLPLPPDAVIIYVLAPSGGIVVLDRAGGERVDMPAATSSLHIVARSTLGTPMPPMSFMMSIDGWLIPPRVAARMARLQGTSLQTNANSELNLTSIAPGLYKFWPYRDAEEAEEILVAPPEPPIEVSVKSGPNEVVVDFQSLATTSAHPDER
ncbi:MAG TPA: carboxypeptidase-like regulatory domain-containing protein, partial [Thermoanaerobaculia bacterium]|nr:carboxypeptidase-like regulatory domain-containing protein [Thermoanaerobaculia bacterium]